MRRRRKVGTVLVPTMVALAIGTSCGAAGSGATAASASLRAASGPAQRASAAASSATASPTAVARTNNANEILLATTTSTQDSGLLDVLLPLFEKQHGYRIKTIAVGSGAAIALGQRGEVDVVLAHAPENERQFVASGAGVNRQLVMYNDFILVGPAPDEAGVHERSDVLDALRAIADAEATFVSRGDNSGTHQLEQRLWEAAGVAAKGQPWYVESGTGMGQTLLIADQRAAYTLTDRATYLAFQRRIASTVVLEGDPQLRNLYHVIAVNDERFPRVNAEGAEAFVAFLLSAPAQHVIGEFGRDRFGQALFTPCALNSCQLPDPDG